MPDSSQIKFGTDGWRAIIGDQFTFTNVKLVAQAIADSFRNSPISGCRKGFVVGYDRRFLSEEFARSVSEVLSANDWNIILTKIPTPTPAISWLVKKSNSMAGVMITASHNPSVFNGLKLKSHVGGSATAELCKSIEKNLGKSSVKSITLESAVKQGRVVVRNILPEWFRQIKKLVNFDSISKTKMRFVHEPLYGVGAGCFNQLLKGTNCEVETIHGDHDPSFGGISPEPVPRNYGPTSKYLRKKPADFCLVTDGDADRIGGMDGQGRALTTHQIICLLLRHFIVNRKSKGRIVKALTTTSMVDKICDAYGMQMTVTGVGFKYICEEMLKGDVLMGFEESGGIGFQGYVPERDGILAGMMVLEMLAVERKSIKSMISELNRKFGRHHYGRIDTHFPMNKRSLLMRTCADDPPLRLLHSGVSEVHSFDGVKLVATDGSWLMWRGSGTEPVLRIYAEADNEIKVQSLLRQGKRLADKLARE